MQFSENVKAKYEGSELYAENAEYSNTQSFLKIANNVKIKDLRGNMIADELIFDIKDKKLNISSFGNNKINTKLKLNEKRF
jgi:lipopolysaccharide export system protein LptA